MGLGRGDVPGVYPFLMGAIRVRWHQIIPSSFCSRMLDSD